VTDDTIGFSFYHFRGEFFLIIASGPTGLAFGEPDDRLRDYAPRNDENMQVRSRDADLRPSFAPAFPSRKRGHREGRVQTAPMARLQKKSRRQSPQVRAVHPAFPARWRYGLYVISSVHRALWPPSRADHLRPLGISVGMPGPHDFAVRTALFVGADQPRCKATRPSHLPPNVRDDRETPL